MASNIVAFAGVDNFDNILYISRILLNLGNKVLIVDHSDTRSLSYSVPQPEGILSEKKIITYRQIDFTEMTLNKEIAAAYDDILIAYGFKEPVEDIAICNQLIWVTDLYRFNYEREISPDYMIYFKEARTRHLLIKDVFEFKITPDIIAERLKITFPKENRSVLYFDEQDYLNGQISHHNGIIQLINISKQLKNYLISEVARLHPEISDSRRLAAYRLARKGE
jgi:hypothetical protein